MKNIRDRYKEETGEDSLYEDDRGLTQTAYKYTKWLEQQVSKLPIHGVSGCFYSDAEIAILKEECYQDGIEEGEMNV